MKRRGMFLVFHGLSPYSGISKKIFAQVDALNSNGVQTELCYYDSLPTQEEVLRVGDKVIHRFGMGVLSKLLKRYDYRPIVDYINRHQLSFLYIRHYANANPFLVKMVKQLQKKGVKVLLEIPTYPYDREFAEARKVDKLKFWIDRCYRRALGKYLSFVVTFGNEYRIFGTRTINISNGIDFDSLPLKGTYRHNSNTFHLILVAELHYWHGVDRAIRGMANYYSRPKEKKVLLHIVGEPYTPSGVELSDLTHRLGLTNHVLFHGAKSGSELDAIFEQADFAIGSLGRHRSGITHVKPLKNREYAARGIPFVYSENDADFDGKPYVIKASADEMPLDIESLINFYDQHELAPSSIRESIYPALSWQTQMGVVAESLK